MNWYRRAQLQESLPYFQEFSEYGEYVPDIKQVEQELESRGLSIVNQIGSGANGVAFLLNNGDVLKITTSSQEGVVVKDYLLNNPHPAIINYKDIWKEGDLYYIILEHVDQMVSDIPILKMAFEEMSNFLNEYKCYDPGKSISLLPESRVFQSLPGHIQYVIIDYLEHLAAAPFSIYDFLNPKNIGIKADQLKFFDIT